ncbi:MAG: phosphonate C-P lyase system protein PhnH [Burkholderiaceae bacterium]
MRAGFRDPVTDSQASFRALMSAMAEPGLWQSLVLTAEPIPDEPAGLLSLALVLLDSEVSFYSKEFPLTIEGIRFYSGAGLESAAKADFVFLSTQSLRLKEQDDELLSFLGSLKMGEELAPEQSATLVIALDHEANLPNSGASKQLTITLEGPGIDTAAERQIRSLGLSSVFWNWREQQQSLYPLGIDLVFVHDAKVLALPRSTRLYFSQQPQRASLGQI